MKTSELLVFLQIILVGLEILNLLASKRKGTLIRENRTIIKSLKQDFADWRRDEKR